MAAIHRTLAVLLLLIAGLAVAPNPALGADPPVCALYCDTSDPSLARQETFPAGTLLINNRRIVLHLSDADGKAGALQALLVAS